MPSPSITTPAPAPSAERKPERPLSDARLSAIVEAAYLLAATGR